MHDPRAANAGADTLDAFVGELSKSVPVLGACNVAATSSAATPNLAQQLQRWTVVDLAGTRVGLLGYAASDAGATRHGPASVSVVDPVRTEQAFL